MKLTHAFNSMGIQSGGLTVLKHLDAGLDVVEAANVLHLSLGKERGSFNPRANVASNSLHSSAAASTSKTVLGDLDKSWSTWFDRGSMATFEIYVSGTITIYSEHDR